MNRMQVNVLTGTILEQFNSFFGESAHAVIKGKVLEVTIGTQTLRISVPEVVGGASTGQSQTP